MTIFITQTRTDGDWKDYASSLTIEAGGSTIKSVLRTAPIGPISLSARLIERVVK
jgi:hypothetical protein